MVTTNNNPPMNMEEPLVSIIIINYNGKHLIERCLSSVSNTKYHNYEIIVLDNNSTDDSTAVIREKFPACQIIQLKKNMGFAIANNIGSKIAKGDYLMFLNNDTYVTPEWIRELISVMEKDDSIAISQSLLLRPDGAIDSSGDFVTKYGRTYSSYNKSNSPREILSARGAAMMVRRSFYEDVGGFDEDYFISFEDVEIGWKARILGYRVVMVPTSIVYHVAGATAKRMSPLMTFHGLKNQLSLITTHFEAQLAIRNLLLISLTLFFGLVKLIFRVSKRTDNFSVDKKAAMMAVVWYLQHLRRIWKKHIQLSSARRVSTKELMMLGLISKRS